MSGNKPPQDTVHIQFNGDQVHIKSHQRVTEQSKEREKRRPRAEWIKGDKPHDRHMRFAIMLGPVFDDQYGDYHRRGFRKFVEYAGRKGFKEAVYRLRFEPHKFAPVRQDARSWAREDRRRKSDRSHVRPPKIQQAKQSRWERESNIDRSEKLIIERTRPERSR